MPRSPVISVRIWAPVGWAVHLGACDGVAVAVTVSGGGVVAGSGSVRVGGTPPVGSTPPVGCKPPVGSGGAVGNVGAVGSGNPTDGPIEIGPSLGVARGGEV